MLSGDEMLARLSEAVGALDQPSMDAINTYFVSWGARQAGLKVTLSGLGGDEVFGGYSTFRRTAHFQRLAAIGSNLPRSLSHGGGFSRNRAGGHFVSSDAARKLTACLSSAESMLMLSFWPHAFHAGTSCCFARGPQSEWCDTPVGHLAYGNCAAGEGTRRLCGRDLHGSPLLFWSTRC